MVAVLYITALILAAVSVSVLGAAFSISGLARLFSGAALAVTLMASALEFSKFVVAAFLHRTWKQLNFIFRTYLLISVVVLSVITSMGIFGFLSDAYQTSSVDLVATQIKLDALKTEQTRNTDEIAHLNQAIDEIPASRITKKIQARKDAEPQIQELQKKADRLGEEMKQLELKNLEVKTKVGPLIYVARAFHQDIDTVVKWLNRVIVGVFDPLAICLVIATSEALKLKAQGRLTGFGHEEEKTIPEVFPEVMGAALAAQLSATAKPVVAAPAQPVQPVDEDVIPMRYVDDPTSKAG